MIDSFSGEYDFLSNFSPSIVSFEGEEYPTVEHGYQAAKTLLAEGRLAVKEAATPGLAKKYGRRLKLREDWEKVKIGVMEQLLREKFSDVELREKLLGTSPHELVEGNWWGDTFWGVCRGKGENHLGKLLMKIRKEFEHGIQ